jgi:hypothetical protein
MKRAKAEKNPAESQDSQISLSDEFGGLDVNDEMSQGAEGSLPSKKRIHAKTVNASFLLNVVIFSLLKALLSFTILTVLPKLRLPMRRLRSWRRLLVG